MRTTKDNLLATKAIMLSSFEVGRFVPRIIVRQTFCIRRQNTFRRSIGPPILKKYSRGAVLNLLLAFAAFLFPASLLAHPSPYSAVMLDFERDGVAAELTLPLPELELSFKHPFAANLAEAFAKKRIRAENLHCRAPQSRDRWKKLERICGVARLADEPAAIGLSSGILMWRPLIAQANSTNNFSVAVTDNSSTPLSTTQSFVVFVNPVIVPTNSSVTCSNGVFQMSVSGAIGADYIVQGTTNLTAGNWISLATNKPTALPFTYTNTTATNSTQFSGWCLAHESPVECV